MANNKKLILVAEDDKFLIKAYASKLQHEGFEIALAQNGEEALNFCKKKKPDVILLDLIMPKKDGFDTLFELKNDDKLKSIPVVVLTNLGQPEDVARAKKLGAADFLVKSDTGMNDIVDKIKEILLK